MTIVFKVSDKLKEKMIEYYTPLRREKTPPYAVFQAMDADTIVTLYESGKVMFQGISADIDAKMWSEMEQKLTGKKINIYENEKKKKLFYIKKVRLVPMKLELAIILDRLLLQLLIFLKSKFLLSMN